MNFAYAISKCLKYINKGKGHNSQIQQHSVKFLKYISYRYGLHNSTRIESSSGPQGVDPDIKNVYCIVGSQRLQNKKGPEDESMWVETCSPYL